MKLDLHRYDKTDDRIFGKLSINGVFHSHTLENPDHLNPTLGPAHIAIPCGTFPITFYNSPHFNCLVPLLHDVPGRTMVEIHFGCFVRDTLGCVLVGWKKYSDCLGQSRDALIDLVEKISNALAAGETITITIHDEQEIPNA